MLVFMSIPILNYYMVPVLKLLSDGKQHYHKEITDVLSKEFDLTEDERNQLLPSGNQTVVENRIGWAKTYLKKAGLIESKKRGYVNITEDGLKELKENPNLDVDDLYKYPSFAEFKIGKNDEKGNPIVKPKNVKLTPEEKMDKNFDKINKALADSLLEAIHSKSPYFFEKLVIDLLLKMGYGGFREDAGITTPLGGDEGIDGIINEDKLGLDKIGVQAKAYDSSSKVGRPLIQSFVGALVGKGLNKGIFITTSSFTNGAVEYADNQSNLSISLIDGEKLANLMIEYELGTYTINTYQIKRLDGDYFSINE